MIRKLIVSLCFLFSTMGIAQAYKAIDTADYFQRKEFLKSFAGNNESTIKRLKSQYSGKTGSALSKIYNEFGTDFEKQVKNKDFIFKSEFETSIQSLIQRLKKNNPQIPQDLKILIARDNTPNAYCLADGTFVINMGLYGWFNNEEQIAAVISHELGHKIQEHSLKSFLKIIEQDKLDKIRVQDIKATTPNRSQSQNQKAFDILKNKVYKRGVERRQQEIQADSLGYIIFKNSNFKKSEFVNALQRLQDFDTISPRELKMETYKKLFNLPKQAFNDKWMKKEDFSLYNYNFYKEKLDKDSLASHPEMSRRIAMLKKTFTELTTLNPSGDPTDSFIALKKTAKMEAIPNYFHAEDYGLGIYITMQFLQDDEEEKYYKRWLGKCFSKIYEARKNYNLNRYLDRVEPKNQSESYQQFLTFMWNLSLDEIKNITDYYQIKES
ncbi:M48 family metalloprotease [Chryseobacterium rhizosphaerae]|uniref:Peptidase M48 n=1 Tax=Chryseobacterium rhizosphaerae TaxID=395937 RepID=A0ABX9IRF3_9FLAO|nr:M48 family metalloprotease [Chryseobacterium rhizosphaerae]MDC8102223.1 M48 family metalloprotease [Chryseobacterium rhizosphaerae]MDR6544564.1 Zn-dependent protease with chaperone function [Chryseobacterium rhizosphaerae]REC78306.1 peptidase M48 [Chryseobacterium rhizosphaerae]